MAQFIDPATLNRRLDERTAVLIDIRDPDEYAREHIRGARLVPLAAWDRHDLDAEAGKAVVFTCRGGNRTTANAARLFARAFPEAYLLKGGIEAWKAAGLPVHRDPTAPLELQRQVQIAVGTMILLGFVLAWLVSPWFLALAAFAGAGLVFAGITGFCGMARLLAALPWNRPRLAG
ncbi:rhodanese-like domain-containing protein [Elioraea sp.]|uniref:rhodanese-like domain-containing protein n=1 Tax=Elioraea sp. TaxID=2185103 RepID=UPI003F716EDD